MGLLDKTLLTMKTFTGADPAIRRAIKNLDNNHERELLRGIKIFISPSVYSELLKKGYLKRRREDVRESNH